MATKIEMKIKNNFPLLWNPSVRGVYMRKLAPARVSYRDDFLISYHVYMMTVSFHFSLLKVHFRLIKYMCGSNRKHYAWATHSSLPADQLHTETSGRFAFTWYRCKISYQCEILAPVQQPEWIHAWVTRTCMAFCGGIVNKIMYSHEREPEWTGPGGKVTPVSCKHPLIVEAPYLLRMETYQCQKIRIKMWAYTCPPIHSLG